MATDASDIGPTYFAAGRGYHAVYRENEVNHCPGCGRTQWIIGRMCILRDGASARRSKHAFAQRASDDSAQKRRSPRLGGLIVSNGLAFA
jgi:hypothetical protein